MFIGDTPQVHLVFVDKDNEQANATNTAPIDHVAFEARDFEAFQARLVELNVDHEIEKLAHVTQVFLHDPNGVKCEIQFPTTRIETNERK